MLPELDVDKARRWCEARTPPEMRTQLRVECDVAPRHLTIVDCRPPWREEAGPDWTRFAVARLRYTASTREWTLYWPDRNERFHRYEDLPASTRVDDLLAEIESDPAAIFWG